MNRKILAALAASQAAKKEKQRKVVDQENVVDMVKEG
jgi:hypothetical protein